MLHCQGTGLLQLTARKYLAWRSAFDHRKHETLPRGLLGLLIMMAFVLELNSLANSSESSFQSAEDVTGPDTVWGTRINLSSC